MPTSAAAPKVIKRYSVVTRASHWFWVIAFGILVSSGLQIFNASPMLDASDKSNPARRVLAIGSPDDGTGIKLLTPEDRRQALEGLSPDEQQQAVEQLTELLKKGKTKRLSPKGKQARKGKG